MAQLELGNYLCWIRALLEFVCHKLLGHRILQGWKETSEKKVTEM